MGTGESAGFVRGQEGDDALVAQAVRRGGTIAGNAGDDVITFLATDSATDGWTFDGGGGDDIISGAAPMVDAGAGDDLISVVGGTAASTVTCGKGFDVVWADSADVLSSRLRAAHQRKLAARVARGRGGAHARPGAAEPFPSARSGRLVTLHRQRGSGRLRSRRPVPPIPA